MEVSDSSVGEQEETYRAADLVSSYSVLSRLFRNSTHFKRGKKVSKHAVSLFGKRF
jgi:hypothetical protein